MDVSFDIMGVWKPQKGDASNTIHYEFYLLYFTFYLDCNKLHIKLVNIPYWVSPPIMIMQVVFPPLTKLSTFLLLVS